MAKHTPGPWITDDRLKTSVDAGKKHIAMVNQYRSGDAESDVWGEEHEANARLIAAAPELLEALRELDGCYCEAGNDLSKEDRHRHRMVLIKARAAIAKATGQCLKGEE